MKRLRSLFAALLLVVLFVPATVAQTSTPTGACSLAQAAFCDTFGAASPSAERSGELDPAVWGVSRINIENAGQGWFDAWGLSQRPQCGATAPVVPGNDLTICAPSGGSGALTDTVNDAGSDANLSWYPRQPFDFAGRTGTVVFDVTDDAIDGHHAWPSFAITTTPAPAPNVGIPSEPFRDMPANGVGFQIDDTSTPGCVTVGPGWTTSNYATTFLGPTNTGCVLQPAGTSTGQGSLSQFNHFEVQVNTNKIVVLGTDAGQDTQTPREIGEYDNLNLSFTRGLIWLQDGHYNAQKYAPSQEDHTFAWRNVGFDGPVLARDLGYEYSDALTGGPSFYGAPVTALGWQINAGQPQTFTLNNVSGVEHAAKALLVYNFVSAWNTPTATLAVNGNPAISYAYPIPAAEQGQQYGGTTFWLQGTDQQGVIDIPLADLTDGTDTLALSFDQNTTVSNVDLILVGAGGVPPSATATPVPATPTTMPTSTPAPVASETASTSSASSTATVTTTQTVTSTVTQTVTVTQTAAMSTSFGLSCSDRAGTITCQGQ